jgi:coenzyme F420-0:L-glutamate ligase / coenzyme F420-1:gamma-L-glutamate ligase
MPLYNNINIVGIPGIKEVVPGDNIPLIIDNAINRISLVLSEDDILVVAQKIISKAEGRYIDPNDVLPSKEAIHIAKNMENKSPEEVQIILDESREIIRNTKKVLITEHKLGLIMANAGIDSSNIEPGKFLLLPKDPDSSARKIHDYFKKKYKLHISVIISDTFGRPWRNGQTNVAVGVSGMNPLYDYVNTFDTYGNCLKVTNIAQADEIASAAELVMGKSDAIPVALIRGVKFRKGEGSVNDLIREKKEDLFR